MLTSETKHRLDLGEDQGPRSLGLNPAKEPENQNYDENI